MLANFLLLKFASSIVRDPSTLKDAFFIHIQAVYNHLLNVQVGSVRFNLFSYSGLSSTVRNWELTRHVGWDGRLVIRARSQITQPHYLRPELGEVDIAAHTFEVFGSQLDNIITLFSLFSVKISLKAFKKLRII